MVSKEIRFASQRVWKTGRCLDCKCAVVHSVWDVTWALPRLLSSAKSRQPHMEVAGTSCTVRAPAGGHEACRYPRDALTPQPGPLRQPLLIHTLHLVLKGGSERTRFNSRSGKAKGKKKITNLKFSLLASSVHKLPKQTGTKLNKEDHAFSLYLAC